MPHAGDAVWWAEQAATCGAILCAYARMTRDGDDDGRGVPEVRGERTNGVLVHAMERRRRGMRVVRVHGSDGVSGVQGRRARGASDGEDRGAERDERGGIRTG